MGLATVIGAISAYTFSLIGRVCSLTGATSYRDAWSKSVGEETSWIPAVACTFKTFFGVLAYSMILADTTTNLLSTAGISVLRSQALLSVTGLVLLPLCWLKDLASLAPFSFVGIMGTVYTALAMTYRYLTKAYVGTSTVPAAFTVPDNLAPVFGNRGAASVLSPSSLVLVAMLSTAYVVHFNAPKFYNELKNNTIPRFNTMVTASFGISIFLTVVVAVAGFLTFGQSSSGLILNNYSNKDMLMSLSRIAVAMSIVFS